MNQALKNLVGPLLVITLILSLAFGVWYLVVDHENAENLGLHLGDIVEVKSGFYKDCKGIVIRYDNYSSMPDDIVLQNVICKKASLSTLTVQANSVKKVEQ